MFMILTDRRHPETHLLDVQGNDKTITLRLGKRGHLNGLCCSLQMPEVQDLPSRKRNKTKGKKRQIHGDHAQRSFPESQAFAF
jgi:hypothetical protein